MIIQEIGITFRRRTSTLFFFIGFVETFTYVVPKWEILNVSITLKQFKINIINGLTIKS